MLSAKLWKAEIFFYELVWVAAIIYSSYHVYLASTLFDLSDIGDDFQVSWRGFKKDSVDYEWATWLPLILNSLLPWSAIHILLTELTRWIYPKGIPGVNCFITLLFISTHYGVPCALFAVFQVAVYYVILKFRRVILVWIFGIPFLLISCFVLEEVWAYTGKDEQALTMMVVSSAWLYLHCTSFCLEMLSAQNRASENSQSTFYNLLGYSFYFPTYFLGPFIIYTDFRPNMYRPFEKWAVKRVTTFLFNMLRFLFWAAVTEISLYFFYMHALKYHLEVVVNLGDWTLYGLGFLMGQFFYMKYVVVYGLFSSIAKFEGYEAPPPPKCVSRIHLYTDMWRYFDVGFYQFMHRYIYTPLCGGEKHVSRRLLASAACFSFVFVWHGVQLSVFIWSLLNYLGVSLITLAKSVSRMPAYKSWEKQYLGEVNSRRLSALLAAPLFVLSPISSFYFFSGINTGNMYLSHLFIHGPWRGVLGLLFVAYCMCQVSIETRNWDLVKLKKTKSI